MKDMREKGLTMLCRAVTTSQPSSVAFPRWCCPSQDRRVGPAQGLWWWTQFQTLNCLQACAAQVGRRFMLFACLFRSSCAYVLGHSRLGCAAAVKEFQGPRPEMRSKPLVTQALTHICIHPRGLKETRDPGIP